MKIFIICPVRSGAMCDEVEQYVKYLEAIGNIVYWPPRNTNQEDPTGFRICSDNLAAIRAADEIHIAWDEKSQGCLFDLGMAFALGKRVRRISGLFPVPTAEKSYQSMVADWEGK